jgi:predicted Zn-dependent protease
MRFIEIARELERAQLGLDPNGQFHQRVPGQDPSSFPKAQVRIEPMGSVVRLHLPDGIWLSHDLETLKAWYPEVWPAPKRMGAAAVAWLLLLTLVAVIWLAVALLLPWLGDRIGRALPAELELKLQAAVLSSLPAQGFAASKLAPDRQQHYQALFAQVVDAAKADSAIKLSLHEHAMANALALPGGVVIFTDPMIALIRSDAEFIGVAAHEIGHVQERHVARQLGRQSSMALLWMVVSGELSAGLMSSLASDLIGNSYSREFEREADDFAHRTMIAMGHSPQALGELLQRLMESAGGEALPVALSTHPATAERVEAARQAAARATSP